MNIKKLSLEIVDPAKVAEQNLVKSRLWHPRCLSPHWHINDFNFRKLEHYCGLGQILLYIYRHPTIRGPVLLDMLNLEPVRNLEFISIVTAAGLATNTVQPSKEDYEKGGLHITELGILLLKQNGLLP